MPDEKENLWDGVTCLSRYTGGNIKINGGFSFYKTTNA